MGFVVKTPDIDRYTVIFQGSKVTGKPLTTTESEEIRKKHTKIVKNARTGEKTEDPDVTAILRDKFLKTVSEWDFKKANGEAYPCTEDTKLEMFEHNFSEALDILTLFDAVTGADAAEKIKN